MILMVWLNYAIWIWNQKPPWFGNTIIELHNANHLTLLLAQMLYISYSYALSVFC